MISQRLKKLTDIKVADKRVLVRADLDTNTFDISDFRLASLVPTLDYLKDSSSKIILMGHKGRPEGKYDEALSLKPFEKVFEKWDVEVLENLRFDPREEENDDTFARELALKADVYVNESFAVSHRKHASIVGVPKYLPHAAGLHFASEVEHLSKVLENPERPVVAVISGVKEDKVKYATEFEKIADKILVGGRLPEQIHDTSPLRTNSKYVVANLVQDKEDITVNSIEAFEKEIQQAGTIVLSGPIGKYEDDGHVQGTKRVFEAISSSTAFKVAGGGDTVKALEKFNLLDKFDPPALPAQSAGGQGWISVGGGAMLEFLIHGTLPGLEALLH